MAGCGDFWASFGEAVEFEESCSSTAVAGQVLDSIGIPHDGVTGGALTNLDIKSMDAMQAIKLSLMDESARSGQIYEIGVSPEGSVYQYAVGTGGGAGGQIYSTIQTFSYRSKVSGVMITGGKPPISRKSPAWKSMFGGGKKIYDSGFLTGGCNSESYSRHVTVVYKNPNDVLGSEGYEDGIDNFYENLTPWESILGYARCLSFAGMKDSPSTKITQSDASYIPLETEGSGGSGWTANLGTLVRRPKTAVDGVSEKCYEDSGPEVPYSNGVKVKIPEELRYTTVRGTKVDGFSLADKVFIVGRKIERIVVKPKLPTSATEPPDENNADVEISVNATADLIYGLDLGKHCVIAYDTSTNTPYVVFANNSHPYDSTKYGSGVKYIVDPKCALYRTGSVAAGVGTILPTETTSGYLVSKVFVGVTLQGVPSLSIYDPRYGEARKIAESLEYDATPIVIVDEQAPVALNGSIIDMSNLLQDHDPTTVQNFQSSEYERALASMDGGLGYMLNMSFLDESGVAGLSEALYSEMNQDSGVITVTIYGPGANPVIGSTGPDGGIINEVVHSYTDSNSYTISATSGPRLIREFASSSAATSYLASDTVTRPGVIIQDAGNHVSFKVMVDGVGPVNAINCVSDILRVGDIVSCSMYNNPIEGG